MGRAQNPRLERSYRRLLLFLVASCLLIAVPGLWAQYAKPTDYQVKAAYLYNFGRFVQWPAMASPAKGDSFNICVLGQDPFGSTLDSTLAGQKIAGKRVAARRISSPQDSGNCQILFLSSSEDARLSEIMKALDKSAVLTVSDMPQFSRRGGMIQFVAEGDRIRFEVNLAAAQNAGLSLSSELLQVAASVRRSASSGD
jgi:YfiR/HmsC-like